MACLINIFAFSFWQDIEYENGKIPFKFVDLLSSKYNGGFYMRLLRLAHLFTRLSVIVAIVILYNFAVDMFQPEKVYPDHVHKTLFIDRNFDEDEVAFITQAAIEWTESTNHIVEFDVVVLPNKTEIIQRDDIVIIKVNPDYPDILVLDSMNGNNTLGLFNNRGLITTIEIVSDRITNDDYTGVVLHELGHALGLEHNKGIDGIGTLMYPTVQLGANYITQDDLKNFCKLYHCDAEKLQH
jgi:hypothetical protein